VSAQPLLWPALALVLNAFIWGVSWWPFRQLQALGLHPLWATVAVYAAAVVAVLVWRPRSWVEVLRAPSLWVILLAAGCTNAAFNWGVSAGDVVRVVLLFYLMPLWSVLLARLLLDERLNLSAGLRVALALSGALIVLWPADVAAGGHWSQHLPLPRSLPDWLGVVGGVTFALNNVMLRREAHQPEAARALAMFLGGALVSAVAASLLAIHSAGPWLPAPAPGWMLGALVLAAFFLVSNMALQYGASRLPAHITSVVMLTEVLFATVSALALDGGRLTLPLLLGGGCIVVAALMSAWGPASD
jgi:drug/metabolite transporter (DMT)-like permease